MASCNSETGLDRCSTPFGWGFGFTSTPFFANKTISGTESSSSLLGMFTTGDHLLLWFFGGKGHIFGCETSLLLGYFQYNIRWGRSLLLLCLHHMLRELIITFCFLTSVALQAPGLPAAHVERSKNHICILTSQTWKLHELWCH